MNYRIKVTQEMVDYVESHRDGNIRYDKDFKLEVGETCTIDGWGVEDRMFMMGRQNGEKFSIPEECTGLNIDDYKKEYEETRLQEEIEEKHKEWILNTDWNDVRIKAAIHILGGMVVEKCIRADEEDTEEELNRQSRTVKRCAFTAVRYADALIEELQKV